MRGFISGVIYCGIRIIIFAVIIYSLGQLFNLSDTVIDVLGYIFATIIIVYRIFIYKSSGSGYSSSSSNYTPSDDTLRGVARNAGADEIINKHFK
ncbi:MAG: hypothetical protein FWB88_06195 [Defluviitaleaceae bacterium]|nr:hypothetical protein [Defluviitaleaceae bacterium]MCL2238601.1 hypothetical protein [Defluviitaleaceae bacterium]